MSRPMRFTDLVNFFERMAHRTVANHKPSERTISKKEQLEALMDNYLEMEGTNNLYPLILLVCPDLDKQGRIYRIKHAKLAQLLSEGMLIQNRKDRDSARLHSYQTQEQEGQGNFSNVCFDILSKTPGRCALDGQGKKTIKDVNEFLDALGNAAKRKGGQGEEEQKALFKENMGMYTAKEWKWLCRIILREMKVGISEAVTLKALHPDATEFYGCNNNNMIKVCEELKDRNQRKSSSIVLDKAFVPMMCQRPKDMKDVEKMCAKGSIYIEKKMDGERLQIHKNGNAYKLYTRKSNDYTSLYKWIIDQIERKRLIKADKCILDAEIVGWWPGDEELHARYLPPTSLKTIGLMLGGNFKDANESGNMSISDISELSGERKEKCRLCLSVFDIVQVEDNSLQKQQLEKRLQTLDEVCKFEKHLFERTTQIVGNTVEDAFQAIYDIGAEEEGVVLKVPSSEYQVGGRNGAGWMKMKPDYITGANDTFDVVIMGGNYGQGAVRSGRVMQYIVGVIEKNKIAENPPKIFRSFCKVGTGLERQKHWDLGDKIAKIAIPFRELERRGTYENGSIKAKLHKIQNGFRIEFPDSGAESFFGDVQRGWPDVVFDPHKLDTVVEVIADRRMMAGNLYIAGRCYPGCPVPIDDTPSHPGMGWTLRFPRMGPQGIREKRLNEAMDKDELWKAIVKSATGQGLDRGDGTQMTIEQKRQGKRNEATKRKKPDHKIQGATKAFTDHIEKTSECMSGLEICVLDSREQGKRDDLILSARSMGADVTAEFNQRTTTHIISLGSSHDPVFDNHTKADRDVIDGAWLEECASQDPPQLLPLEPRFMLHASKATSKAFANSFDRFGDSYTKPISEQVAEVLLKRGMHEEDGSEGGYDPDQIVEDMEIELAVASITEGQKVRAYVDPGGGKYDWVECVVQEYLVEQGDFVMCCADPQVGPVTTRHEVQASHIDEADSGPSVVSEWSVFRGVRALLVERVADPAFSVPRTRLARINLLAGGGLAEGSVQKLGGQQPTHVVVDMGVGATAEGLDKELRHHGVTFGEEGPWVVDVSWVMDGLRVAGEGALDLTEEANARKYLLLDRATGRPVTWGSKGAAKRGGGWEEGPSEGAKRRRVSAVTPR